MKLRLEPLQDEDGNYGYEFVDEITGGVIPREYIPSIDKGIVEQMQNGVIAGHPPIGVKATLIDGSFHEVDSSEMAFKIAAAMALREGAMAASPVLLEPVMTVEVVTPEDYMGDVVGDLNRRRGMINGMEENPAGKVVRAEVPLSEMFGYSTDCAAAPGKGDVHHGICKIRGCTRFGNGSYPSIDPSHLRKGNGQGKI